MMINKITSSVDYNKQLKHLDIKLNEPTNQNSTSKKTLLYNKRGTQFFEHYYLEALNSIWMGLGIKIGQNQPKINLKLP